AEHREALASMSTIAQQVWSTEFAVRLDNATIRVHAQNSGEGDPPAPPRHPSLQEDAPPELVQRLEKWVSRRVEMGYDFGRAALVLGTISNFSVAQARFMWPCIRTLCAVTRSDGYDERLREFADKLSDCTIPSVIPAVTPQMRRAMRQTNGVITAACMLDRNPQGNDEEVRPSVWITLSTQGNKRHEEGIGTVTAK
ncbi:MAG: hypothetical protein ACXVDA_14540, partial [Ktedonobacterales bacterium]